MVRRLKSTGLEKRPRGADERGCETEDLVIVHRTFRWMFRELPLLVAAVPDGDAERTKVVADHVSFVSSRLHGHHEAEDLVLWDRITDRAPACALHVDDMRRQHAEVAGLLGDLDPLVPAWRERADAATRDRIVAASEAVRDTLERHLGEEEAEIVPVAAVVLTQREWDGMGEHVQKELTLASFPVTLGLHLASVSERERTEWIDENLPAPFRLAWRLLWRRRYEAAMDRLYAGAPVPPIA